LGVENFNVTDYIEIVKKHNLEISQPATDAWPSCWVMTGRQEGQEVHLRIEEQPGWGKDRTESPCAAFVEIQAPVLSRQAWRGVWHMIQNELVHGWGLDFIWHYCVNPADQKIGVVDPQWSKHNSLRTGG
jgi:hypothetical protein